MARTPRETNLATRSARERLKPNPKPYWRHLDAGLHLGYRRGLRGAKWVVRWYLGDESYKVMSLEGRPDDGSEADGETVLNWSQAQAAARKVYQQDAHCVGHRERLFLLRLQTNRFSPLPRPTGS